MARWGFESWMDSRAVAHIKGHVQLRPEKERAKALAQVVQK